jgi:hypothetical protein
MNQRNMIVLPSRLNPHDIVSGSALGDFKSDRPGSRFSVYAFACVVRETETAGPTTIGQGRCK